MGRELHQSLSSDQQPGEGEPPPDRRRRLRRLSSDQKLIVKNPCMLGSADSDDADAAGATVGRSVGRSSELEEASGYLMDEMDEAAHLALRRFLSHSLTAHPLTGGAAPSADSEQEVLWLFKDDSIEFSDEELSDLVYAFMACDLKGSGAIDAEELQTVLSVFGARRDVSSVRMLFQKIDTDGNGLLDENEIRAVIEELAGGVVRSKADAARPLMALAGFQAMFNAMDANKDGVITVDEFESWWEHAEDVNGISKRSAIGWARQLRLADAEAIITETKRQYRSDSDGTAVAIRQSPKLARAIGTLNLEKANELKIGFSFSAHPSKPSRAALSGRAAPRPVDAKGHSKSAEMRLGFQEYVYMMAAGTINQYLPDRDWRAGAVSMRNLRAAFDTADVDGSDEIDFEEFEAVMTALHHTGMHHAEFDVRDVWKVMNPRRKKHLSFADFVAGIAAVQADDRLSGLDLAAPNPWELLSLVIDTPVSKVEEKQLLAAYGASVRFGMETLRSHFEPLDKSRIASVMAEVRAGTLHKITPEKKSALMRARRTLQIKACLLGVISGVLAAAFELLLGRMLQTNGRYNPADSSPTDARTVWKFWLVNYMVLGCIALVEIALLYFYAIKGAVRVARCLNLRLVPFNRDRAFVAAALVRTAMELGNSSSSIYGVDPHREKSGNSRFAVAVYFVIYRAKIALTSGCLKLFVNLLLNEPTASVVAPLMVIPATGFWNVMVAGSVMSDATITALGIATSIELFNALIEQYDPHVVGGSAADGSMPESIRLQVCRAIAVAIVKHGDMHPVKELLLRHCIQFLGLQRQLAANPAVVVGDASRFVAILGDMDPDAQRLVLQVHLLALVLDGHVSRRERQLWKHVCANARRDVAQYDAARLFFTAARFRKTSSSLETFMLLETFAPHNDAGTVERATPPLQYRVAAMASC